jgi:hypothetical protein
MSTKKRKVGAKRMWSNYRFVRPVGPRSDHPADKPVFVLPATKEDYEAMVKAGSAAAWEAVFQSNADMARYVSSADTTEISRAVLASLNINPPKK